MKEAKKIIVLVDFLEDTDEVIDYAVSIAAESSIASHFLHIVDIYKDDPLLDNLFVERCEKKLIANAERRMARLLAKTSAGGAECTGEVVTGKSIEKIIERANVCHSDLIMIGPNGF